MTISEILLYIISVGKEWPDRCYNILFFFFLWHAYENVIYLPKVYVSRFRVAISDFCCILAIKKRKDIGHKTCLIERVFLHCNAWCKFPCSKSSTTKFCCIPCLSFRVFRHQFRKSLALVSPRMTVIFPLWNCVDRNNDAQ